MKIDLKRVTLYNVCYNERQDMLEETVRVINYMQSLCVFGQVVLFSSIVPMTKLKGRLVQIPRLDAVGNNVFLAKLIPELIRTDHCMSVHPDGFIVQPELWQPHWLKYDFIGAPWEDDVVGNGGFSLESRRCLRARANIPFIWEWNTDEWFCRRRRTEMEERGVIFAPLKDAINFSTETCHCNRPSFGFHGHRVSRVKYNEAWRKLIEWENNENETSHLLR